uniref:Reverse transcriptase domain-containing protein n=1 Tax=Ditylenchus dipsaci TaxID=166011 RepID=A0A915DM27_9BILA
MDAMLVNLPFAIAYMDDIIFAASAEDEVIIGALQHFEEDAEAQLQETIRHLPLQFKDLVNATNSDAALVQVKKWVLLVVQGKGTEDAIEEFLISYRTTPSAAAPDGKSPAEVFWAETMTKLERKTRRFKNLFSPQTSLRSLQSVLSSGSRKSRPCSPSKPKNNSSKDKVVEEQDGEWGRTKSSDLPKLFTSISLQGGGHTTRLLCTIDNE